MRFKVLFILALLFLPLVYSLEDDIYQAQDLELLITQNGKLILDKERDQIIFEYVNLHVNFIPLDDEFTKITKVSSTPSSTKDEDAVVFTFAEPQNYYEYTISHQLQTHYAQHKVSQKVSFPIQYLDTGYLPYTKESEIIDINDDIIAQASLLAQGEDDLYVVVSKVAIWVKENIEYSLNSYTQEAALPSSWVLQNRQGVCDELTALFISMLRSLDIPARFVSGIAYTNSDLFENAWGAHGWAEVYFPGVGWVAYDPTYGEFGFVDATHIPHLKTIDAQQVSSNVIYKGKYFSVQILQPQFDITILNQGNPKEQSVVVYADIIKDTIDIGSYTLIKITIKNPHNYYQTVRLDFSKTDQLHLDTQELIRTLEPYEELTEYVLASVDSDLSNKFIYTFPFKIYEHGLLLADEEFKVSAQYPSYTKEYLEQLIEYQEEDSTFKYALDAQCIIQDDVLYVGESTTLECTLENKGNTILKDLVICADICSTTDLYISQQKTFTFSVHKDNSGSYEQSITFTHPQLKKSVEYAYEVLSYPTVSLTVDTKNTTLAFKENAELVFTVIPGHSPLQVKVQLVSPTLSKSWEFDELNQIQTFKLEVDGSLFKKGSNTVDVIVTYEDLNGKIYTAHDVLFVTLEKVTAFEQIQIWLIELGNTIMNLFNMKEY